MNFFNAADYKKSHKMEKNVVALKQVLNDFLEEINQLSDEDRKEFVEEVWLESYLGPMALEHIDNKLALYGLCEILLLHERSESKSWLIKH